MRLRQLVPVIMITTCIIILFFPGLSVSKPQGTEPGTLMLYLFKSGTGSEKDGIDRINAVLGDTISIDVFVRNPIQAPLSAIEIYLTVPDKYFNIVPQGYNTDKKYSGQPKPFIQGNYFKGAGGAVMFYGNNTWGDTLTAMDNKFAGWQLNYVEMTGADEGSGRPVSRLLSGVIATFKLIAKAPCDTVTIALDEDRYNIRMSQYIDPYSSNSYSFTRFTSCKITVSGIKINPPLSDLRMMPGASDSTLDLRKHISMSSLADSLLIWSTKGNNRIATLINPKTHMVTFTAPPGYRGYEDIVFTVSAGPEVSASDTMRVTVDSPPNLLRNAIPDTIVIHEDSLEVAAALQKVVEDKDDEFKNLIWFFKTGGKVNPMVRADTLFLKGIQDYNGLESLRLWVYDSFGLGDSLTVPVKVLPVNDPPVLNGLPDVTIQRGETYRINIQNYASDVDGDPLKVSWKTPQHFQIREDKSEVAITGIPGFLGKEDLIFTVTDPGGFSASDTMLVTLTPAKKPPVWSAIPKTGFPQNRADSSLVLWNYVSDPDDPDSLLTFVFANRNEVDSVYVNPRSGRMTLYDLNNRPGWDRITVTAFDPDGNRASIQFNVYIGPADGTPIVAGIPDTTIVAGTQAAWIDLNDYYYDYDNTDSQMTWTWGRQANSDSSVTVSINSFTHVVQLKSIDPKRFGMDRIFFTVTDPTKKFADDICIISVVELNKPSLNLPSKVGFFTGGKDSLNLDDYVSDAAYTKSELFWTWSGNRNTILTLDTPNQQRTRPVSFSGPSGWVGWERVVFEVRNPLGGAVQDTVLVFSVPKDGTPVAGGLDWLKLKAGECIDVKLNDYCFDWNTPDNALTWKAAGNDSITVTIEPFTNIAHICALSDTWEGQEQLTFTVKDPENHTGSMTVTVTVTDAVARNIFSLMIFRNPMQEDYMDIYASAATAMTGATVLDVLTERDSTRVVFKALKPGYYYGRYLLPLDLSIGIKGTAFVIARGKTASGKAVQDTTRFAYGRFDKKGGKAVLDGVTVDFPPGALTRPVYITIVRKPSYDVGAQKNILQEIVFRGDTYTVGPTSLNTTAPFRVEFPIGSETMGAGIYRLTDTGWEVVGVGINNGMVQANVYNGGTFRVGLIRASPQSNDASLPGQIFVEQNVPNPFNSSTTISFSTTSAMSVKISIYDLLGRRVRQFESRQFPSGRNTIRWNALDDQGNSVSTGVYILSITGGSKAVTRKMLYIR